MIEFNGITNDPKRVGYYTGLIECLFFVTQALTGTSYYLKIQKTPSYNIVLGPFPPSHPGCSTTLRVLFTPIDYLLPLFPPAVKLYPYP